jgi:hypothetical protein
MTTNKTILAGVLIAFIAATTIIPLAAAQAYPTDKNSLSLEDQLALARQRVLEAKAHPGAGSGTPFLDASGVVGASIISGSVFGGIFIAFVTLARRHAMVKRQ